MHAGSLALVALLVPSLASAQQVARDTARVAPIVVTATRSAMPAHRAPATVTVLSGARLRAEGVTTVVEALRRVPGVTLAQTGSYGGASSMFVRGGESKFTKVLIDGVPVNDAGGAFDFATLSTDNIDRIEVLRGPGSVLYGSDAMAGVVQLFTRRRAGAPRGELSARGGQLGTVDVDGAVRGSASSVDYSLGAAHHGTRGFQAFNSDHRLDVGSALLGYTTAARDGRLTVRYSNGSTRFPTDGSGLVTDSNAVRRERRLTIGAEGGMKLGERADLRLALASHGATAVSDDQPDSPGDSAGYYYTTDDRSSRRSADLRLGIALPGEARVTLGGTTERQWLESGTTSNFGDTPAEGRTRRSTGGYAQLLLVPGTGNSATLGARYEHNERFGDFVTWRAASSVGVRAGTRLRASAGTAFREPTFIENFGCCGFVRGNADLAPEHALSVDAGVEQEVGRWGTLGVTLFENSFRDLIDYRASATGPNYVNLARTRTRGVEVEARVTLPAGWDADAALTYLDARVVEPGASAAATALFVDGARLLRRPMHTLEGGIGYRAGRGGWSARALRVGRREDNYFAPDFSAHHVTLAPYTKVDLSADVVLRPPTAGRGALAATLRVDNLLDARYTETAGFNYDFAQADLSRTGYRSAPRRVLGGVRVGL